MDNPVYPYKPKNPEKPWQCLVCGKKFTEGELVTRQGNGDRLRHITCQPKRQSKPASNDKRRFDRGRVIYKTGGL